ncbi:MAG: hypothetical protein OEM39_00435 [Acidimicrobiia bacterium]|nr:hypothetical protein [Acidimicrobiia bacterium]MDH3463852.1 hypothetical protein [Acidimicrobiia bacterium]
MASETPPPKRRPPWLIGLVIAVLVFAVLLIIANLLGYGDDPAVGDAITSLTLA